MDDAAFFLESQRFTPMWVVALAFGVTLLLSGVFGFGLYQQIGRGIPFGTRPISNAGLILISVTLFGVLGVLDYVALSSRMITEVRADGVHLTARPFLKQPVFFAARSIRAATPRDYDAIREHNGWGIRRGASGPAYTAHGNRGVDLDLGDGRHILIGSQDADGLAEAIARSWEQAR
jgi:hypothetical protein